MTDKILSDEDYAKILQERFKTKDIKYVKAEWCTLSENIEGYMGNHYILKIIYKVGNIEHSENFFVKTKLKNSEYLQNLSDNLSLYIKEIFFYNNLLREYEKMGYFTGFAPKGYYFKDNETIVMESLKEKGYKLTGRDYLYDVNHCKVALKALAYYHGNYLAFEETKSLELNKTYRIHQEHPEIFTNVMYIPGDTESIAAKFIESTRDCLLALCKLMPETEEWKKEFETKFKNLDPIKIMEKSLPYRRTCTHGDLWCNNMLFNYSGDTPISCCLVDYQVMEYRHPSYDALLLIYTNTRRDVRKNYRYELLDYYYHSLEEILKDYGIDISGIYPKEHFLKTVEIFEPVSILRAIAGRTMTFLPLEVMNAAAKSEGAEGLKNVIEGGRVKLVKESFLKSKFYRNILTEDLYDLYEHL